VTTRQISFANSAITITYQGDLPTRIVDFLYRHIPAETAGSAPPYVAYQLCDNDQPGQLTLSRDDTLLYRGDSLAVVAELLLGDSCHHLADRSQGGLLLHAAGLTWHGQALLLPGQTGAGKSTLTAWLVSRGFGYLTDELVFVLWGQNSAQGLTRPLNLKRPARSLWQTNLTASHQAAHVLSTPHSDLAAPTLFGTVAPPDETSLGVIIFPRYEPGSNPVLRPLSRAKAGLALMQCLLNARNLPDHGFTEVTRLARQIPAYHLRYSRFSQLEGQIESLLLQNKG
jgi:hypothetical protein